MYGVSPNASSSATTRDSAKEQTGYPACKKHGCRAGTVREISIDVLVLEKVSQIARQEQANCESPESKKEPHQSDRRPNLPVTNTQHMEIATARTGLPRG
jgi:hypothetical protein